MRGDARNMRGTCAELDFRSKILFFNIFSKNTKNPVFFFEKLKTYKNKHKKNKKTIKNT